MGKYATARFGPLPHNFTAGAILKAADIKLHAVLLTCLMTVWFVLYTYSDAIGDIIPGLIICSNDCTDLNDLSDYLVREGWFAPYSGDFHTTPFYWLYVAFVGLLKVMFGSVWHIAYAAIMAIALYGFIVVSSRWWRRDLISLMTVFVLLLGNLTLLTYGRTLLTDFVFALGAPLFFMMLARAWVAGSMRFFAIALGFAGMLCLLRPNGVFLLCLGIAVIGVYCLPRLRGKLSFAVAAPIVTGLAVVVFSAAMSVQAARNLEAIENGTFPLSGTFGQFLEFNYTGDDGLTHENRLGALLTNTPYKSWYMNDGTHLGMLIGFAKRVPKTFEIRMPSFSERNNLMRLVYYGVVYAGALGFLIGLFRGQSAEIREKALFAALVGGYLLIFVAMSHVTLRFRMVFDVSLALAAADFYASLLRARGPFRTERERVS